MNLANVSDANGGPLSVVKLLGDPYCKKSCMSFHVMVSAVFLEILKVKEYLLKVSATNMYSLFLKVKNQQQGLARGLLVHLLVSWVGYAG